MNLFSGVKAKRYLLPCTCNARLLGPLGLETWVGPREGSGGRVARLECGGGYSGPGGTVKVTRGGQKLSFGWLSSGANFTAVLAA